MGDISIWGTLYPGVKFNQGRKFTFNLSNRAVQTISGNQRRNRKSIISIPILNQAQKTADQLTKGLYHIRNTGGVYQIHSDCFELGAVTQGLGFCYTYISKHKDIVSGDVRKRYIDPKSTMYDPYFRKHDLSDCRFWEWRQYLDKAQAALDYPELSDYFLNLPAGTYRDDKFFYMPEVYQIQFPNLCALDEYWYLSNRQATYLIDRESEECQEWIGTDEQLKQMMQGRNREGVEFKQLLAVKKAPKKTVRRTIILNDRAILDEADPNGIDRYPVSACLGFFNADTPYYAYKFRGIVRDMLSAQCLFDRRKVADLDILESQQQGLKMERGALITPDDALNSGNGRVLVTKEGALDKVVQMDIHAPSPVMLQMEQDLKQVMIEISMVSEEMMGANIDDKAGILAMTRINAGITTLQKLFDQFDEFSQNEGEIDVAMMQSHYTYGKMKQILGEDPTPEFDNKLFFQYGCKVVQGVLTESQQQLESQQLIYARSELGMPISANRILSTLQIQDKDEIIKEVVEAEKQQAEMTQKRAQLEMQQIEVDNQTKLSYANSQNSLAHEREQKVQLEKAESHERLKRAKEEELGALLNFVKSLKEIQGMDRTHVKETVEILNSLKPEAETQTKESTA